MWIITKDGFYSAVYDDDGANHGEGRICVRARAKKDLDRLKRLIPSLHGPVESWPGSDYAWRAWCSPQEFAAGVAQAALEIDYPNFKAEVEKRDKKRASLYHRVWSVLGSIQPGGPFSRPRAPIATDD